MVLATTCCSARFIFGQVIMETGVIYYRVFSNFQFMWIQYRRNVLRALLMTLILPLIYSTVIGSLSLLHETISFVVNLHVTTTIYSSLLFVFNYPQQRTENILNITKQYFHCLPLTHSMIKIMYFHLY